MRLLIVDLSNCDDKWSITPDCVRVSLADDSRRFVDINRGHDIRVSPIFPVLGQEDGKEPLGEVFHIGFFCLSSPFPYVGKLISRFGTAIQESLWYSHGLANLILITEGGDQVAAVKEFLTNDLRGFEHWRIERGFIVEVVGFESPQPIQVNPQAFDIPDYANLPLAIRFVIDEYIRYLEEAIALASRHVPEELKTFQRLSEAVGDMLHELMYLNDLELGAPDTLKQFTPTYLEKNPVERDRLIHQRIARIVQINSGLSYVVSQAFSGAVPLLSRRCLIRRHSLLGIGFSVRAVTRLARGIEQAFEKYPIDNVLAQEFTDKEPLPGYKSFYDYDSSGWIKFGPDKYLRKVQTAPHVPKLVYFSGRLGFRETEFAVSVGLQVLVACDSLEWNIITLTHELLHGHVRDLLGVIFQPKDEELPQDAFERFYECFDHAFSSRGCENESALDSIRNVVLSYCLLVPYLGSLTRLPRKKQNERKLRHGIRIPPKEKLWRTLEDEYRNISEILVHILDFHYFYGAKSNHYIEFIWNSWSAVPHVSKDPRPYVLRTLLSIASKLTGDPMQRFERSVKNVRDTLKNAKHQKSIFNEVLELLKDEDTLLPSFIASVRIADLARYIFYSGQIQSELFNEDENVIQEFEGEIRYFLESLCFEDISIASPTSFVFDRLRRRLNANGEDHVLETESVWSFLAYGSSANQN